MRDPDAHKGYRAHEDQHRASSSDLGMHAVLCTCTHPCLELSIHQPHVHVVNKKIVFLPRRSEVQHQHYTACITHTHPSSPTVKNVSIPSPNFCLQTFDCYASSAAAACKGMELLIGIAFLKEENQSMVVWKSIGSRHVWRHSQLLAVISWLQELGMFPLFWRHSG